MAARCALPATAATAWPRWTASPTCGRARRPRARGWPSSGIRRPTCHRSPSSSGRTSARRRRAWRSRFVVSRWTSRSWVAGRRGSTRRPPREPRAGRSSSSTPRRATRSSRSTPAPRSSPATRRGCSTSMPTRWSWRPVRQSSSPSAPGTTWPGSSRPAPRRRCTPPASTWAGWSRSGRHPTACRATRSPVASSGSRAVRTAASARS